MNYVLDTHALIWKATGRYKKLGRNAARAIDRAERGLDHLHLSVASLMEILQLVEHGRLRLPPWSEFKRGLDRIPGLTLEDLTADDVEEIRGLAALVDPFDRMITATALRLGIPLITADERISTSRLVETIW